MTTLAATTLRPPLSRPRSQTVRYLNLWTGAQGEPFASQDPLELDDAVQEIVDGYASAEHLGTVEIITDRSRGLVGAKAVDLRPEAAVVGGGEYRSRSAAA